MRGHVEMKNPTAVVGQHEKHVQDLKSNGRHDEEVDGYKILEVMIEESATGLGGQLPAPHHVLADTGFANRDAELEQFAVDAWRTPQRILVAHLADQSAHVP